MTDRKTKRVDPGRFRYYTPEELDRIAAPTADDEDAILADATPEARELLEAREAEETDGVE